MYNTNIEYSCSSSVVFYFKMSNEDETNNWQKRNVFLSGQFYIGDVDNYLSTLENNQSLHCIKYKMYIL